MNYNQLIYTQINYKIYIFPISFILYFLQFIQNKMEVISLGLIEFKILNKIKLN